MSRFQPGRSGNPAGRPAGARHKLAESFIAALSEDWQAHGKDALERVRQDKPEQYVKVVASILPRDINVGVENPLEDLSDEELDHAIEAIRVSLAERLEANEAETAH